MFVGKVDGAAGTNAIELAVGSAAVGLLSGVGSAVTNFSTLQFDSGATWTVEGSAAGLPGTITGFAVGDTIDVDGFAAVSDSYNGSGLVLTDAVGNTVTLCIQGNFTTGSFALAGDGSGGTDSGGREIVLSGGTAATTIVDGGGNQVVSSGGRTTGTVLSGGVETVSAGGAASGTTVYGGGVERNSGTAIRIRPGILTDELGAHRGKRRIGEFLRPGDIVTPDRDAAIDLVLPS